MLSQSRKISAARLPANIDDAFTVIEITLEGANANPGFLRRREDLVAFGSFYRQCLAGIISEHPTAEEIHLFPAVPAPVAVLCGHELLKRAQPSLVAYDSPGGCAWVHEVHD